METLKKRYSRKYAYDLLNEFMYSEEIYNSSQFERFCRYEHGLINSTISALDCVRFVNRFLGKVVY